MPAMWYTPPTQLPRKHSYSYHGNPIRHSYICSCSTNIDTPFIQMHTRTQPDTFTYMQTCIHKHMYMPHAYMHMHMDNYKHMHARTHTCLGRCSLERYLTTAMSIWSLLGCAHMEEAMEKARGCRLGIRSNRYASGTLLLE